MTAEGIEKALRILEIQFTESDMPRPEYERKKRELERKLEDTENRQAYEDSRQEDEADTAGGFRYI